MHRHCHLYLDEPRRQGQLQSQTEERDGQVDGHWCAPQPVPGCEPAALQLAHHPSHLAQQGRVLLQHRGLGKLRNLQRLTGCYMDFAPGSDDWGALLPTGSFPLELFVIVVKCGLPAVIHSLFVTAFSLPKLDFPLHMWLCQLYSHSLCLSL